MIPAWPRKLCGFIASKALIVPIAWLGLALAARSDDERSPPTAAINTPPAAEARYMGSTACASATTTDRRNSRRILSGSTSFTPGPTAITTVSLIAVPTPPIRH